VSDLRIEIEKLLTDGQNPGEWLTREMHLPGEAAEQVGEYFADTYRSLGAIPSQQTLVMERFFDESGGMQLVLHSPFGNRINRAWGLALRKRFCRSFNFELQAAATDDAIVISLGTQHSFPLEEVFRYLNSKTVRDLLVQALLDAPMFTIRWRWNATRSLAVPRFRGGSKIAARSSEWNRKICWPRFSRTSSRVSNTSLGIAKFPIIRSSSRRLTIA
jgi:ATP-dependent Lhr-like helicase